jgi:hypothetical protein
MKLKPPYEKSEDGRLDIRIFKDSKGPLYVPLYAPNDFFDLPIEMVEDHIGGCGPGDFGDKIVPDSIWGLNIVRACEIHDFCFRVLCDWPQKRCDVTFRNNIKRLITQGSKRRWLIPLRLIRMWTYYFAVRMGKKSKNKEES